MKLTDSLRRWSLITFLPSSPDKKAARQTALLWKALKKDKPLWYDPVTDRLTRDFATALLQVKTAVAGLTPLAGLAPGDTLNPSVVPRLVERLAEAFVENSHLTREKLTFKVIHAEVSAQKGADYRGMQHLLQTRMQSLPKAEGALWEKALPSVEGLLHLIVFDWSPLAELLTLTTGRQKFAPGADCVEALEDLTFVLEPLTLDPLLETLVGHLADESVVQAVTALGVARVPLLADGQLLNVIRAIRAVPDHKFRRAVYEPPTLSSVYREWIAEFDAELQNHRNETERLRLAARMREVFGDRELSPVPAYNEETSAKLVERRLPELTYVSAIKVLHNVHEVYHDKLFQPLIQGLQMELDFLTTDAKGEFQVHIDAYYSLVQRLEKFLEDLRSPTYSKLAPVMTGLQAPFLDQKLKQALKKPIEETNQWAFDLSQVSARQYKALHLLLEKYVIDLEDSHPHLFSGGSVLISKHPKLVADLKASAALLKGLNGLLRQLVADTEEKV